MATEIISGPKAWWKGECSDCGTEFRCTMTSIGEFHDGDAGIGICPTCREETTVFKDVEGYEAELEAA